MLLSSIPAFIVLIITITCVNINSQSTSINSSTISSESTVFESFIKHPLSHIHAHDDHHHHHHHHLIDDVHLGESNLPDKVIPYLKSSSHYYIDKSLPGTDSELLLNEENIIHSGNDISSIAVAQEMLFSGGGKYVPPDDDYKNIYRKYLKKNIFVNSKCHLNLHSVPNILSPDLKRAFSYGDSYLKWYIEAIKSNARQANMAKTTRLSQLITRTTIKSKFLEFASQSLISQNCVSKYDAVKFLPTIDLIEYVSEKFNDQSCTNMPGYDCDPLSKYRTADASCNNLANPTWTRSFSCHRRLLPPDYADGIEVPRVAHDSSELPNPRLLSTKLLPDIPLIDNKLTSITMSFGQFIVHDIARTMPFGSRVNCCPITRAVHPECLPIYPLEQNDFLYRIFNQTCLNFVRSRICNSCNFGPREQENESTQVFDMSQLYGLTLNDTLNLRRFSKGKLRSIHDPNEKEMLTTAKDQTGCNISPDQPRSPCFQSGDGIRSNQHPALQSLHTVFHRRHNQHAEGLSLVNPHWSDEKLFQETRRIVIAEMQKIIYGEYVPAISGKALIEHFGLELRKFGYTRYDPTVRPSTIQEYIVAAGRFGHSQINDLFRVLLKGNSYSFLLRDAFFETSSVRLGHVSGIIKGLIEDATSSTDPFFVTDVKNFLYKLRVEDIGRDLPAFNILRGREHGVPGYVNYLEYCFGYKIQGWKDLQTFIPTNQLNKIRKFYKSWKDIDLFVGGISERRLPYAAFGPTFACINGIQFHNLKYGDRFYFEHGNVAGSFTDGQLDNIRMTTSLANVFCKAAFIEESQPNVFFLPSSVNAKIPCELYPEIDYKLWSDFSHLNY